MGNIVVAEQSGVLSNQEELVVITTDNSGLVVTGIMGPSGADGVTRISDMSDIDKTGLVNGALLVYSSAVDKWRATTDGIQSTSISIDSGEF